MKPTFYSKWAMGGVSLALSPILGCILFSYNLKEIGKGKIGPYFIIGGLFGTLFFKKLVSGIIENNLLQLLFSNFMGSLILTFYFWDKFFINYPSYDTKPIWKPVIVFVSICVALILFQVLVARR